MKRRNLAVLASTIAVGAVLVGAPQALAWGTPAPYTAPWGCKAQFESKQVPSFNRVYSSTDRVSGSCGPMWARLKTASGSVSGWDSDLDTALVMLSPGMWNGGHHRVCDNCTIFVT